MQMMRSGFELGHARYLEGLERATGAFGSHVAAPSVPPVEKVDDGPLGVSALQDVVGTTLASGPGKNSDWRPSSHSTL